MTLAAWNLTLKYFWIQLWLSLFFKFQYHIFPPVSLIRCFFDKNFKQWQLWNKQGDPFLSNVNLILSTFGCGCFHAWKQLLCLLEQINCPSEWQVSPLTVRLEAAPSIRSKLVGNNRFYVSPSFVLPVYKRILSDCCHSYGEREKGPVWLMCKVLRQNLLLNEGDRERTEISFQQPVFSVEATTPKHSTKFGLWYKQASSRCSHGTFFSLKSLNWSTSWKHLRIVEILNLM